jgi:tetratricopeptide (TPR) repeat protein
MDQVPDGAGTKRSVDETFRIAIGRANEKCPAAGHLLGYLAFCGGTPIAIDILSGAMEDTSALSNSVTALRELSLISDHTLKSGPAVVVHRLIQEYCRNLAEAAGTGNELQNRLVSQLLKLYPTDGYEEVDSWDLCEELTPHALAVWRRKTRPQEDEPICSLINLVGLYFLGRSELEEADQLLSAVLAIRDRNPSTPREDLSLSLHNLALLRDYQSKLREAYELCSRAYQIREETGDPLLSWTVNNLAYLLLEMGRYADALPYSIKNIEMTKEEYMLTDPAEVATALDNHAVLLMRMRDLDEARRYCVEALEIRERECEPQPHSDIALSRCHLGQIMMLQGEVEQGEAELNISIDMYARTIGQRHVDTAEAIGSLGDAVRDRDPRGARKLYSEAIAIYSDKGVERHHDAVRSYFGLGQLEEAFGAVSEARRLYTLACSILEEKMGREHPETQQCLARLARLV